MLGTLEDHAIVGALTLEHGAGVMQAMSKNVDIGLRSRHQFAV
jgi:hypothetical protein